MTRGLLQVCFGAIVGLLSLLMPGRHSISVSTTAILSLTGAIAGRFAAQRFLPADVVDPGGFPSSAIGAIAVVLIYVIAAQ